MRKGYVITTIVFAFISFVSALTLGFVLTDRVGRYETVASENAKLQQDIARKNGEIQALTKELRVKETKIGKLEDCSEVLSSNATDLNSRLRKVACRSL